MGCGASAATSIKNEVKGWQVEGESVKFRLAKGAFQDKYTLLKTTLGVGGFAVRASLHPRHALSRARHCEPARGFLSSDIATVARPRRFRPPSRESSWCLAR